MPTFASVNGNAPLYYVAITITNSQTTATPAPFQQMITINSSNYSSYLASNLQNVNFQDGNGNIIPSWLESGNSNTSTSTIYWVSLANGIGASSSVTIYYCIYATTVNCFNTTNTGVAPQLTSTYAQYDDGANVFTNYWNFAGTSLPSNLTTVSPGYSINNGITFNAVNSDNELIGTTSAIASPGLLETYATGNYGRITLELSTSNTTFTYGGPTYENGYFILYGGYVSPPDNGFDVATTSGSTLTNFSSTTSMPQVFGIGWVATGNEFAYTYTTPSSPTTISSTNSSVSIASSLYILFGQTSSGDTQQGGTWTAYWLRTRAYPPNGVMPSTSLGSLTQSIIVVPTITYSSEGETYSIPTLIKQPLTYSTETETYSIPTLIKQPVKYSIEAETEQQIQTTLEKGSLLQTINYNESETETLKQSIFQTINYNQKEVYSIPTLIKQPINYSEAETEKQILTTLEKGSLLQTINYSESETETLKPQSIFQTINYKQRENYNIQTEIEAKFIYDNNETEKEWLSLLGIPHIKYNNTSLYSILYNNTLSDSKGNFINNLYMHIPFNQTLYPKQINYNLTSSYLPPETNVSTVYASDIIPINLNFTFNISLSANTSTYVVTATVTDSAGNAIPNVVVNFSASGGTVSPTSATTNSSGQCTTTASGANVTVTASATLLGVTIISASVTT